MSGVSRPRGRPVDCRDGALARYPVECSFLCKNKLINFQPFLEVLSLIFRRLFFTFVKVFKNIFIFFFDKIMTNKSSVYAFSHELNVKY